MQDRTTRFEVWLARSEFRWRLVEWIEQFGLRLREARVRFICGDDER
jgi:hypothetical protein